MLRKIILTLVFLAMSVPFSASAQNVQCTGTANPANNSSVRYNFVQKTCTIQDNLTSASGDEITFNLEVSPPNPSGGGFVHNVAIIIAHTNCQLDGVIIPNGSRCSGALGINGNRTSTVTLPGLQTLTVNHTVSNNGSSIDITSAFGVPAPPVSAGGINLTIERINDKVAILKLSGTLKDDSAGLLLSGMTIGKEKFGLVKTTSNNLTIGGSGVSSITFAKDGITSRILFSKGSQPKGSITTGSATLTLIDATWSDVGASGDIQSQGTWKMVLAPVITQKNPPKGIDADIKRISDKVAKFTFSGDPTVFNDALAIRSVINGGTAREQIQLDGNSLRIGSAELSSSSSGNRGENALFIFNKGLKEGDNPTGSVTLTLSSGTWAVAGSKGTTNQGGNWSMFADDTPKGVDMVIERISDTVANIKLSGNTTVDNNAVLGISDVISGGTNLEKIQLTNNKATIAEFLLRGSTINDKSTGIFLTFVQTSVGSVAAGSVTLTLSSGTWNAAGTKGNTSQGGNWEMVAGPPPPGVNFTIERISDTVAKFTGSGKTTISSNRVIAIGTMIGGDFESALKTENNIKFGRFVLEIAESNPPTNGMSLLFSIPPRPAGDSVVGSVILTLRAGTWVAAGTKGTTNHGGTWEMIAPPPPPGVNFTIERISDTVAKFTGSGTTTIQTNAVITIGTTINGRSQIIITENTLKLGTSILSASFSNANEKDTLLAFSNSSKPPGESIVGSAILTLQTGTWAAIDTKGTTSQAGTWEMVASLTPPPAPPVKDNSAAIKDLHSSVSRSQSFVVSSNIGARLTSASNAGAIDDPYVNETELGMMSFKPVSPINSWESDELESQEISIRELAMMTSFDSSRLTLSAMGEDKTTGQDALRRSYMVGSQPITLWGHGSYISLNNNRNLINDDRRYNGNVWGYNIGIDYRFKPGLVAGVSAGYSETDVNTPFNSGSYKETDYTFSPYALYKPNSNLTLSVIGGYSFGYIDRSRDFTVTSNTDSRMWFSVLDGAYRIQPYTNSPLNFTPHVSFLISRKNFDGYSESDGTVVNGSKADTLQLKPGLETSYNFKVLRMSVQPFVKADFVYDFIDPINDDKSSIDLGGGLRIASAETGLSGSFEWQRQFGREDYNQYTLSGLVAYNFSINGIGTASPYVESSFNGYGNLQTGMGIKFLSEDSLFNTQVGLKRSNGVNDNTSAQFKAELKF